jgi:hypothetical protein
LHFALALPVAVIASSAAETAFVSQVESDVSTALNVSLSRVHVLSVAAGSLVVACAVLTRSSTELRPGEELWTGPVTDAQVAAVFFGSIATPTSPWYRGDVLVHVVTSGANTPSAVNSALIRCNNTDTHSSVYTDQPTCSTPPPSALPPALLILHVVFGLAGCLVIGLAVMCLRRACRPHTDQHTVLANKVLHTGFGALGDLSGPVHSDGARGVNIFSMLHMKK